MPDIAGLLKAEIVRLSKKTVRQHLAPLQRASQTHRHEIASLKKQIVSLERQLSTLKRTRAKPAAAAEAPSDAAKHRFVAKGLRSLRTRLGVSQQEFGALVGVSAQSVYNWERQTAKPRPAQLAAIAAVREMGKRAARARLDELAGTASDA